MIMSVLAKNLKDKVKERQTGFLLVSKALELISKATDDSPIDDVKEYLLAHDIDKNTPVYHNFGGSRFEVLDTSCPDGYFTGTRKALKEPLEGNEYFLADDLEKFQPLLEYDIFAYERGYHYIAKNSVGKFVTGEKVTGLTEHRAIELLKIGAIEKQPVKNKKSTAVMNNSLASYMTEYTLPQIVALILHIDLADITTSPSNSYINNQNKYGGEVYQKFENLLQSYSIAALNNKVDGAEVHTRIVVPFGGGQEVYVNLEKTTISKSNLASYLSSIGCQLDDLIAKQEPIHGVQSESGQVLRLTQQLTELQEQLMTEKSLQAEIREEAIEANVKILNLTAKLENAELDSIIHSHPAHKLLLSDAQTTIDQLSKGNAEPHANKEMSTSQSKYNNEVSDQTVEKLKKMTADYEELSSKYESINTQNQELVKKLDLASKKIKELNEPDNDNDNDAEQLSDNTAKDYQVTIGILLELLQTSRGFDKEGKANRAPFLTQNDIITAITDQMIPNQGKTKIGTRFANSNAALAGAKKKREDRLDLADKINRKAASSN